MISASADTSATLSRRTMLAGSAAAAGAFTFGFAIPFAGEAMAQGAVKEINAWVVVHPDDKVVIRIARSEMGQGTLTGLAQLVAEELNCDWARVTTEYPTPGQNVARNRVWGNFSTGGSRGIRESHEYVRKGGAAARMMLIQAAANQWSVPAAECSAEKSIITHKASGRSLRYGQVAEAASKLEAPKDVPLKDPKDWTIAGKPLKRLDTVDKTNGAKIYGIDLKMPGMLNAAIKDCPVFGGKVKSFDAAKVKAMPGVTHVVPVGETAVAVVAETWWQAKTALDALPIEWDNGENAKVSSESIAAWLKEGLDAPEAVIGNQVGDAKAAIANAARVIESVYSYPFQNHATMEPMNATARYTPERCEVWTPTQNGEAALAAASEASGLPIAKCEAYKIDLGGGFGRRGAVHDWVRQVVAIAKQIPGTPIKLIWSREEDMLHGRYHPVTQCKLTGALDKDGNLTGLHMRISGQSIVAGIFPQNIQNGRDPAVFQGLNPPGPEASIGYGIPARALRWRVIRGRALRPTSAERDQPHRSEDRKSQTEAGVARGDLAVHLFLANRAADVAVHVLQLPRRFRGVRLPARDLGDARQLSPVYRHRLPPATNIDVAVGCPVSDGVDRDRLGPRGHGSLIRRPTDLRLAITQQDDARGRHRFRVVWVGRHLGQGSKRGVDALTDCSRGLRA